MYGNDVHKALSIKCELDNSPAFRPLDQGFRPFSKAIMAA